MNALGYGAFNVNNKMQLAHRVAWVLWRGPIPKGKNVLHECDVPACVNPAHLFLGTHQDNVADRDRKGRTAQGIRHYRAKLNDAEVIAIRSLRNDLSQDKLAQRFGVSQHVISCIQLRQTWKAL